MPQLSLYIDDDTLKKIKKEAKKSNLSISQWVRRRINDSFEKNWPNNYFDLFGSIHDESFVKPSEMDFKNDNKREVL